MSITTSILTGGVNNHQTTAEEANRIATDFVSEGVVGVVTNTSGVSPASGDFAVNAQSSPNMTVAVSSGAAYVTGTPTSQGSQTFRTKNSATANVTIASNTSGSTKYDWIYIKLDPTVLAAPNTAGDNAATLVTSRSSIAGSDDGTPPTYGYPLAVVTVANGAINITNGNITDKRTSTGIQQNIQDGSVTAAKINFSTGIWWEEIGRTTLSVAGDTISVTGLPSRKYVKVLFIAIQSGVISPYIRFNNDSGNNYNYRYLVNYSGASGSVSQSAVTLNPDSTANDIIGEINIDNISTQEKLMTAHITGRGGSGAGAQATSIEVSAKWANTADVISRIDLINNGGAGDFAIGSEVVVLGHN